MTPKIAKYNFPIYFLYTSLASWTNIGRLVAFYFGFQQKFDQKYPKKA
jgi:hypothetical protein